MIYICIIIISIKSQILFFASLTGRPSVLAQTHKSSAHGYVALALNPERPQSQIYTLEPESAV